MRPRHGSDRARSGDIPPRRLSRARLVAGAAAALALLAAYGFLVEPYRLVPATLTLKAGGVRAPVRLALFSDVAFRREGRRERDLARIVRDFEPDAILVAGDFLDRAEDLRDPAVLARAASFLEALPAPSGRYLALGEEEVGAHQALVRAWSGRAVTVLDNDARTLDVRGTRLELFGADPAADPISWWTGAGDRPYVFARWRPEAAGRRLDLRATSPWPKDVDVTLAFQAEERDSYVAFGVRHGGHGWDLIRHEDRPDVRIYSVPPRAGLSGRPFQSGFTPPAGRWCRARLRVRAEGEGARIQARFWPEGDAEPDAWTIDVQDDRPGTLPVDLVTLGAGPGSRRYADLAVADAAGSILLSERFEDRVHLAAASGSRLAAWLTGLEPGVPAIVLTHGPDAVIDVADSGASVALVAAGHTHGGQVRLPGLGSFYPPMRIGRRYDRGFFRYRDVPLYVTPGVGTSVVPFRLFSPPEVTLITLEPRM